MDRTWRRKWEREGYAISAVCALLGAASLWLDLPLPAMIILPIGGFCLGAALQSRRDYP